MYFHIYRLRCFPLNVFSKYSKHGTFIVGVILSCVIAASPFAIKSEEQKHTPYDNACHVAYRCFRISLRFYSPIEAQPLIWTNLSKLRLRGAPWKVTGTRTGKACLSSLSFFRGENVKLWDGVAWTISFNDICDIFSFFVDVERNGHTFPVIIRMVEGNIWYSKENNTSIKYLLKQYQNMPLWSHNFWGLCPHLTTWSVRLWMFNLFWCFCHKTPPASISNNQH